MSDLAFGLRDPLVLILSILLGFLWFRYRRSRKLLFVRTVIILLLLFLLADPLISYVKREKVKPVLPVLIDVSKSMVIDEPQQRSDSLRSVINKLKSLLEKRFRLEFFEFWSDLQPYKDSLMWTHEGTAIGDAIETIEKRLSPPGILLVTDGASNMGKHPLWVAKYTDFPIFVLGFGPSSPKGDISITRVRRNTIVYAEDEVPVEVWIKADGYKGETTSLWLKEGERVIATEEIKFKEDLEERVVKFKVIPRTPGTKLYQVSMTPLDRELNLENNSRKFALKVLKSKNKILYISSSPNWEYKFLKLTLETDPTLELHSYISLGEQKKLTYPAGKEIRLTKKNLVEYDCIIIHNIPYDKLPGEIPALLAELVGDLGKSLLLIGGEELKGYAGSRLEEMLPVIFENRVEKKPFQIEFTPEGKEHPVIKSAGEREDLPPLLGCNRLRGVKPGSTVWATNPAIKTPQGRLPVITQSIYGKGKVVVITCFPLWRWFFLLKGLSKEPSFYTQFLTNLTRWLSTRKDINPLVVELGQPAYQTFEEVEFSAELYDEDYRPIDGAFIKIEIEGGKELTLRPLGEGKYTGTISNLPPRKYQFTARAYIEGKEYATNHGSFEIVEGSIESQDYGLQKELLEKIASLTGGDYYTALNLNELSKISFPKTELKKHQTLEFIYWPVIYIALLTLLIIDWTVRRLKGL